MSFDSEGNGVITKVKWSEFVTEPTDGLQAELLKILKANHMASADVEVARKADTIMSQADKVWRFLLFLALPLIRTRTVMELLRSMSLSLCQRNFLIFW